MKPLLHGLLLLILAIPCHAGWETHTSPAIEGSTQSRVTVSFHPETDRGVATLDETLLKLSNAKQISQLVGLSFYGITNNEILQKEIFTALERIAPEELASAKHSAGNIHNPKMLALAKPFEKAVLTTPTVKRMQNDLANYQLTISKVSHEKLSLVGDGDQKEFHCFLWLTVSSA